MKQVVIENPVINSPFTLWLNIRDHLPKKGRKTDALTGEPKLPKELQGALHSLYGNYEKHYRLWEGNAEARAKGLTPPVFIVVCNNTNVSKLVFDYVAGWEKKITKHKSLTPPSPTRGEGELNLIIEVTGEHKKTKIAKVSTARTLWIPAVNNHGGFGRWAFIEIADPWNAKNEMRAALKSV